MAEILKRLAALDSVEGRTIHGRIVPYGESARVNDGRGEYTERFEAGAFTRSIEQRGHKIRLMIGHDEKTLPIGSASSFEERSDGMHAAFTVADTTAGNDALELVRTGVVDSFSIGFAGVRSRTDRSTGAVVRTEVSLREVSLVASPAYVGAEVLGVRTVVPTRFVPATTASARLFLLREK